MKLLFVCLGNICRSPTAEGVMRLMLHEQGLTGVDVDSAGTAAYHAGEAPDPRTIKHARDRGYDLSTLRARQLAAADFVVFDRIFAMDQNNLRRMRQLAPDEHLHKLELFLDVLGRPGAEVPDPWTGGFDEFEHVLDLVEAASRAHVSALTTALRRS